MLTISYPPRIRVPIRSERVGNWPNDSFSWVKRLMRESVSRTAVSPEIVTYHSYVLGGRELPGEGELTRSLDVVENIIVFLNQHIAPASQVLELCSGTGVCTTPLSRYYSVVAIDNNEQYCSALARYLDTFPTGGRPTQHVELFRGDVRQQDRMLDQVGNRSFAAVVLNPPFDALDIIADCFEFARAVTPTVIIGVLPLDVLVETDNAYSWRRGEHPNVVDSDRQFISKLRADWKIITLEPTIRSDGTAQVGTFVFKRPVK